jgi:hypothetical protein
MAVFAWMVSAWLAAAPAAAQTVGDLIAANLAAKGGAERLQAIASIQQTSRLRLHGGIEGTVVLYGKRPRLLRQEMRIAGQTVIKGFDGARAWAVDPTEGTNRPTVLEGLQAEALRDQAGFEGLLMRYLTAGRQIDHLGYETRSGRRLHHLRVYDGHRRIVHVYLDEQTLLEARIVVETDQGRFEQDLLDYREVEGVRLPFVIRTAVNGQPVAEMAVESVVFGAAIDEALFRMPGSAREATAR